MSMKENVDYLKDNLNNEEKFLESFIKVERFYKKYKKLIIVAVIVAVLLGIGFLVKKNIDEQNKLAANIAFDKVLKNKDDKESIAVLKEKNYKLYEVAKYLHTKKDSKTDIKIDLPFLKELLAYENSIKAKNIDALNDVSMQNDFLLKEFAIFNKAILLINEKKYAQARNTLKLIPNTSRVFELSNLLKHYLLTK